MRTLYVYQRNLPQGTVRTRTHFSDHGSATYSSENLYVLWSKHIFRHLLLIIHSRITLLSAVDISRTVCCTSRLRAQRGSGGMWYSSIPISNKRATHPHAQGHPVPCTYLVHRRHYCCYVPGTAVQQYFKPVRYILQSQGTRVLAHELQRFFRGTQLKTFPQR